MGRCQGPGSRDTGTAARKTGCCRARRDGYMVHRSRTRGYERWVQRHEQPRRSHRERSGLSHRAFRARPRFRRRRLCPARASRSRCLRAETARVRLPQARQNEYRWEIELTSTVDAIRFRSGSPTSRQCPGATASHSSTRKRERRRSSTPTPRSRSRSQSEKQGCIP